MKFCVVLFCFTATLFSLGNASTSFGIGPCPGGRKVGDTWLTDTCEQCLCVEGGYRCEGCLLVASDIDRTKCYIYADKKAKYPDCCTPHTKCRGEEGFDESKL